MRHTHQSSFTEQFDISTGVGAQSAIRTTQNIIDRIGAARGEIGAFQSRLEVAVRTLHSGQLELEDARSRIVDTDVAADAGEYIRLDILKNFATAVLAQANFQPALAIELLRDD